MPYLTIAGGPVYHEVAGTGPPLLLLHGGFCSLETMRELGDLLARRRTVHAPERAGHGRTPDRPGPASYDAMVAETLAYLDALGLDRVDVVGFSDGANVGLLMVRDHPERVGALVAISGNLDPAGILPDDEQPDLAAAGLDVTEAYARLDREYAELSPDGPGHAAVMEDKLMAMWLSQPDIAPASMAGVRAPVLVMAGELDMIAPAHSRLIADSVPAGRLVIVPLASHLLVGEQPDLVAAAILDFLAEVR